MYIYNYVLQRSVNGFFRGEDMDFSRYIIAASYFVTNKFWWLYILFVSLFFAVVFVLQAIALYTIASREGYKIGRASCRERV